MFSFLFILTTHQVPAELVGRAGDAGDALRGGAGDQGGGPGGREEGGGARPGRQGAAEAGPTGRGGMQLLSETFGVRVAVDDYIVDL